MVVVKASEQVSDDLDQAIALAATVPGYFPVPQLRGLAQLGATALQMTSGGILEIGSYCGRSTVVLGTLAKFYRRRLTTVDRHLGSIEMLPPFEFFDASMVDRVHGRLDSAAVLLDTLEVAGLRETVQVIIAASGTLLEVLQPGFGLVLIDGAHDPLSTWIDYLVATSLLAPHGTLMIDDVFENPSDGGRPPYEIMVAALHSGFQLTGRQGPLVALRRSANHAS